MTIVRGAVVSRRFLGLLLFAVGLAALVAGFQIVALVSAATGLLFIASTARPGRGGSDRGGSGHAGSSDSYYYGDHRNDDDRVGGSDGDSGGGGDGGGGGGD
ncbi:MAG: hypothetical protein V4673_10800 [Pseudomonadota bacterium]